MTAPDRPIAADWLALRRAADTDARDRAAWLVAACRDGLTRGGGTVTVFDVGAGTGANRAYLDPRLGVPTRWVLLDHDAALLRAPDHGAAERVVGGIGELDRLVAAAPGEKLMTCSALLDLLSNDELDELAAVLARHRTWALFSLTVDGSVRLEPAHRHDPVIAQAVNDHQSRDSRPGPAAAAYVVARCEALGLPTRVADTPWLLDASSAPLIRRLLTDRADAALEQDPKLDGAAQRWLADRMHRLDTGELRVRVGHVDLTVTPES